MISMKNADLGSSISKQKPLPGKHVCAVTNIRQLNGYRGTGFWLDLEVLEGPSKLGFQFSWGIYPDNNKPGGKLSVSQLKALDEGKIQACIAAAMGYPREEAGIVDDTVYGNVVVETKKAGEDCGSSPLTGRKVVVDVISYESARGPTVYYQVFPYETEPKIDPANLGATATPPAPPAPPSVAPAGWTQHPENPKFFFNAAGAVKTLEQIQAGA